MVAGKVPPQVGGGVTGRARAPYRLVIEPSRLQLFRVGTVPTRPDTWRPPAHPFMPRLEVYLDPYDSADRAELARCWSRWAFNPLRRRVR